MKKIQDIIGLPLISIDEATELGEIKDVLLDPDEGRVKYLLIMDEKWYLGGKLVSFDRVLSIGSDAVTVQDEGILQEFSQVEDAMMLAKNDIKILGAKVFTEKGRFIGVIEEYYISEEDGSICKCLLDGGDDSLTIENPKIISFSAKTLVIKEPEEGYSEEPQEKLKGDEGAKTLENAYHQTQNSARLFEEKQRQFLLGRKAICKILDESGDILLEEGQVLTNEILSRVKNKNKIIELTINTR